MDAIAACAGVSTSAPNADYGFDGRWHGIDYDSQNHRYSENGFSIDYKLKSTVDVLTNETNIVYDLEVKNYRDLIKTNTGMPRILILYILPRNSEWVSITDTESVSYKGAWWVSLKDLPNSDNETTVRIRIPIEQQLTPKIISELFGKVKKGDNL